MKHETISHSDFETLSSFRQALREFLHFSEEAAKKVGLTPQQHQALLAIKGNKEGTITIGELAKMLKIQSHSAVGLVNRLVMHNLAQRQAAPRDKRQVLVVLTETGESMLEKLSVAHRQELRRLRPVLTHFLNLLGS
ncbi:MAG: MarR family transcriptional regulator [Proteobacteria bacterium]|nr:MarR family transcriptional regulator [Pseudomonadota bacterium]